jgi:hypothetical protein
MEAQSCLSAVDSGGGLYRASRWQPGEHCVRMNMYIVQAKNGNYEIVKNLDVTEPRECTQGLG